MTWKLICFASDVLQDIVLNDRFAIMMKVQGVHHAITAPLVQLRLGHLSVAAA